MVTIDIAPCLDPDAPWCRAWAALAERTGSALTPALVAAARAAGTGRGAYLVLRAHQEEALVAVWPLQIEGGLVRVARHIGSGSLEEYAAPIIDPARDERAIIAALFAAVARRADIVELYNLARDSASYAWLKAAAKRGAIDKMVSCSVMATGSTPWDEWLKRKSKSFRAGLRQDRKRLGALGTLGFERVRAADAARHIDWCLATKCQWLDAQGLGRSWLRAPASARFFAEVIGRERGWEGLRLTLDGAPVAGCLCIAGPRQVEFFLTVYDEAYARYSPGNLLIEDVGRWCAEQGRDFDLRFPLYPYKARWADTQREVHSLAIATSARGGLELRRRQLIGQARRGARRLRKWVNSARARSTAAPGTNSDHKES